MDVSLKMLQRNVAHIAAGDLSARNCMFSLDTVPTDDYAYGTFIGVVT